MFLIPGQAPVISQITETNADGLELIKQPARKELPAVGMTAILAISIAMLRDLYVSIN